MQINDILDEPMNAQERADAVVFLLEMIERMSGAIERHQSDPKPDQLAIEQFTDLRTNYIGQLALLMNQYGVNVQLTPSRQAA